MTTDSEATASHTPVMLHGKGWRIDTRNGGVFVPLLGAQGDWLADIRCNGEFHTYLVTAVNAHDQLVAQRDALLAYCQLHEQLEEAATKKDSGRAFYALLGKHGIPVKGYSDVMKWLGEKRRAALASLTGAT